MNTTQKFIAAAAIALLSAGTSFAQEATPDSWLQSVDSNKSRAEVSAELTSARQSGLTKAWSAGYMEPVRQSALRTTVRAQTLQAIESGELDAINAEVYGYTPAAATQLSQARR